MPACGHGFPGARTDMDDETIAAMARKKIFYVPTIDHNRYYVDNARLLGYPGGATGPLNVTLHAIWNRLRRRGRREFASAMGSDAVYTMFGENNARTGVFVKAGMTTGTGAQDRDGGRGGAAGDGGQAGTLKARLLCRHCGGRGRSAIGYRRGDSESPLGE